MAEKHPPPSANASEAWREAFPEVPVDELDAPGMWSDPNFSLSKSANIGEFGAGERDESSTNLVATLASSRGKKSVEQERERTLLEPRCLERADSTPSPLPFALLMRSTRISCQFDIDSREGGAFQSSESAAK